MFLITRHSSFWDQEKSASISSVPCLGRSFQIYLPPILPDNQKTVYQGPPL